jgi:hypothetical protein
VRENLATTSVNPDEEASLLPKAFELKQNYPNPFNPVTTIRYMVGSQGDAPQRVELTVHNILGQKIATLVSEKQPPGRYQVQWDASGVPSGIYFYQLTVKSRAPKSKALKTFIKTRKMVLMK